ncbi:MAG: hypothetical protein Q7R97_05460 [Candidatus Daviesbacteria bacterium]|nr:hypothetical protein [Candidatus Daviesbacteria bacterium]
MAENDSKNNDLPPEFRQIMEEENTRNKALIIVDALLEENPNMSTEEAFIKAGQILAEESLNPSENICHNDKDDR